LKFGKRLKRALATPKRYHKELKTKAFAFGYTKIAKQYDSMIEKTEQAAKELELGVASEATRRFFSSRACDFFPGKATKHLYSEEDIELAREFKLYIESMNVRWALGEFKGDAAWLRETFIPFLEECKQGDLQRLQRGFKLDEGVFVGESEPDSNKDGGSEEDSEGQAAVK